MKAVIRRASNYRDSKVIELATLDELLAICRAEKESIIVCVEDDGIDVTIYDDYVE